MMAKERPIIFDAESVRAILDGSKRQTRRVIKPQPTHKIYWNPIVYRGYAGWTDEHGRPYPCPYGKLGDRLWVREPHTYAGVRSPLYDTVVSVDYRADDKRIDFVVGEEIGETVEAWIADREVDGDGDNWRSPIYMPRWASRITLEITDVRVESLHSVDEDDLLAEGAWSTGTGAWEWFIPRWDSINKRRGFGWDANPWVFVVDFRRA